jgi:hypothetical protein
MKTISINNGEVRNGYEFNDLSEEAKNKVLNDQINFEIEVINEDSPYFYLAEKMEKMQTPWFLGEAILDNHKEDLIDIINVNEYLFDEEGEMLPIIRYMKDNKLVKTTYGKKEYECIITDKK